VRDLVGVTRPAVRRFQKRIPNPNSNGRIDVIGNVGYNILNLNMRTGGDLQLNEIGNYYYRGAGSFMNFAGGVWSPVVHTSNNRTTTITSNTQDNTVLWNNSWLGGRLPVASDFRNTPFPLINYTGALPDGDESLLKVQNRELGCNKYLDNNGNAVLEYDEVDILAYDEFDNDTPFDWDDGTGNNTQASWRVMPQRIWLVEQDYGVIQNEHNQTTHKGVVPNSWITSQGLNPATFDPAANDLDPIYTNIEVYSFQVDNISTVNATAVTVEPSSATVNVPDTVNLNSIFTPLNTTDRTGVWSSSDTNVAIVDNTGFVTAVAEGTATITFTSNDGGFSDTSIVTVEPPVINVNGVSVSPNTINDEVGTQVQLSATIIPIDATDQTGSWSSNNNNVATVDQNGLITGVGEGTTEVTFTSEDGGYTDLILVSVSVPTNIIYPLTEEQKIKSRRAKLKLVRRGLI